MNREPIINRSSSTSQTSSAPVRKPEISVELCVREIEGQVAEVRRALIDTTYDLLDVTGPKIMVPKSLRTPAQARFYEASMTLELLLDQVRRLAREAGGK